VADVCEALIGAAFVQYNRLDGWKPEDWDAAVKATTVMVKNEEHEMLKWDDYIKAYDIPEYQTAPVTAVQRDLAEKVELEHPYHFKWPRLLRSAFNHPSNPSSWDKVPSYQRLEFLGDSLLDTACVSHLFYRYPDKDPQWLTEHKMAMVSNKFLGALCVKIGFHRHMRHCHSQLDGQIREYVIEATEAEKDTNGACDYWTSVKAPPKCLPDIVEAYVGAIFVDSGFNYGVVQTFFDMHIKPFFEDMTIYDTFANNHPTTFLHNLLAIQLGCRDYRLLAEEVPQGDPGAPCKVVAGFVLHDRVVCHATSQSGRYAKVKASVKALELLQGLAPFEFRQRYGCDCRDQPEDEKSDDEGKFERQSGEDGVENMGTAV
jgi:endoribonuclease Dicer